MSSDETPTLLTVPEVAERLRVGRATVYRRIADGTLPAFRLGNESKAPLRVDADELAAWLRSEPEAQT